MVKMMLQNDLKSMQCLIKEGIQMCDCVSLFVCEHVCVGVAPCRRGVFPDGEGELEQDQLLDSVSH